MASTSVRTITRRAAASCAARASAGLRVVGVVDGRRASPRSGAVRRLGQGRGDRPDGCRARRRARHLQPRAVAGPGAQSRAGASSCRVVDRTDAHPRHLRAARAHARGQGAGRARPARAPCRRASCGAGPTSSARRAASACGGPGETQLETDRRLLGKRVKMLKERLAKLASQRDEQRARARRARTCCRCRSSATPTPASPRCSTALTRADALRGGPALRDARHHHAARCTCPSGAPIVALGHGRLHPRPAAHAGRRVPRDARGDRAGRPAAARGRRGEPGRASADRGGQRGARRDRRGRRFRSSWC